MDLAKFGEQILSIIAKKANALLRKSHFVIASNEVAKQSILEKLWFCDFSYPLDCFVALLLAMTILQIWILVYSLDCFANARKALASFGNEGKN